jgi:AmiR/NasT family two-component response regulator
MMETSPALAARELWLAATPPNREDRADEPQVGAAIAGSSLKVLIVEDEFFIALDNQDQIEELGHTVVGIASSAEQAVGMAEREKPDVVLMDIRLNGLRDGIDAAAEIGDRYGIASIFLTANTDPATLQRAEQTRPLGILQKPLEHGRLRAMLARVPVRKGN